jgi:hypothetical protein
MPNHCVCCRAFTSLAPKISTKTSDAREIQVVEDAIEGAVGEIAALLDMVSAPGVEGNASLSNPTERTITGAENQAVSR